MEKHYPSDSTDEQWAIRSRSQSNAGILQLWSLKDVELIPSVYATEEA